MILIDHCLKPKLSKTSPKPRFLTVTARNNFVLVKKSLLQFDQETFGTKYVLTIMTFGIKIVPNVKKNFGAKFVPKEVIHFGTIIVPNVYKCFIFFKK